ncbi:P-loop NTPase fold protein [Nitratireductor sp. GZWM139]|uniref:KAP family P-loop NTPase fold protein n=1 Tax=Nitratireductor sp. GZWM139 TaxID=2950541 RepID=UPI0024BD8016|nr:P-loop NTPase fold protein [Nitratireductor sp. GZWM139]MDJ1463413.1 KAP family NTPase [Nitratireductor sp. GZWM139]
MEAERNWNADAPLRSSDDDLLGFQPSAEKLAASIAGLSSPDGYVLGLQGEWGSGKSSYINFLVEELEHFNKGAGKDEQIDVIRFSPWLISGHHDLIAAYFKVLNENLPDKSRWPRWLQRLLPRWVKRILAKYGFQVVDPVLDTTAKLAALALDPTLGVGAAGAIAVGRMSLKSLKARLEREPSLQEAYQKLVNALKKGNRRFLVIIDDVDRITADEIRDVMRLVKSVGRLPHVTYLLAYDRQTVWSTLDGFQEKSDGTATSGRPAFAEKIIQQELEMPRPYKGDLFRLLDKTGSEVLAAFDNNERFNRIAIYGLRNWISKPRDAVRLGTAINWAWKQLEGELDPVDIVAMEALRLFDYDTFIWVRGNREFLADRMGMIDDDTKKSIVQELRKRLVGNNQLFATDVLAILFPGRAKEILESDFADSEPRYRVEARSGIGNELGYDTYFGLNPPPGEMRKSEIDTLMRNLGDRGYIEQKLRGMLGKSGRDGEPLVGKALAAMNYRFQDDPTLQPTDQLLQALLAIGDDIVALEWTGRWFTLSADFYLAALFRRTVERRGQETATKLFLNEFAWCSPLISSFLTLRMQPDLKEHGADPRELLTAEQVERLQKVVFKRITAARKSDELADLPSLWPVIAVWQKFAKPGEIKRWVNDRLREDPTLIGRLPLYSMSSAGNGVEYRFKPSNDDTELYDNTVLVEAASKVLAIDDISPTLRQKATAIVRGVTKPKEEDDLD